MTGWFQWLNRINKLSFADEQHRMDILVHSTISWLTSKQHLWSMLAWHKVIRDGLTWENHSLLLFFLTRGKMEYGCQPHRRQQKGPEVTKQRHPDSNHSIPDALQDLSSAVISSWNVHMHIGFSLQSLGQPAQALWKPYMFPTSFRSSRWGLYWRCSVSLCYSFLPA